MPESAKIYQFKVALDQISPPVWRRVQVSEKMTLFEFHKVIQIIMEWQGHHLHQFIINGQYYTDISDQEEWESDSEDEFAYSLKSLKLKAGSKFTYEYDFGDGWRHSLTLEEILLPKKGVRYPICIKGKNACPPDDVGGPWGYKNLLEAIKDPNHEEHESLMNWMDGEFDPTAFNLEEVNQELFHYAYQNWPLDVELPYKYWLSQEQLLDYDLTEGKLRKIVLHFANELPLIKDAVGFLSYLNENKVTGTLATGNLTRKAIQGIVARFVNSDVLEKKLDDLIVPFRNENEVPEIYFLHVLLQGAGLIEGGRGLKWQVTNAGEGFLSTTTERQFLILFEAWWYRINWIVISVFNIFDGYVPDSFINSVIEIMKNLEPGLKNDYELFITQLAQMTHIDFPLEADDNSRLLYELDIERMLIKPLSKFGLISPIFVNDPAFTFPLPKFVSFKLTELGWELFNYIAKNKRNDF